MTVERGKRFVRELDARGKREVRGGGGRDREKSFGSVTKKE